MRRVLALILTGFIAGCSQTAIPSTEYSPLHAQVIARKSAGYVILYSFKGGADGAFPETALTSAKGELYGTTNGGDSPNDYGTIFKITPSGQEQPLHRFTSGADGANPLGKLLYVSGTLYGTTSNGGSADGYGTIFQINVDGSGYKILHRFKSTPKGDGAHPASGVTWLDGALYGLTQNGGANGYGAAFATQPNGNAYKVLYSFAGAGARDAADPEGELLSVKGALYGTSYDGGSGCNNPPSDGCGTVFAITKTGEERILFRFGSKSKNDGANPATAGLVYFAGLLYGTTSQNANSNCFSGTGCGTVFSLTLSGTERIVHRFGSGGTANGATPMSALIAQNALLYGSTWGGGSGGPGGGNGTIFQMTTAGAETVLYNFGGPSVQDGAEPNGLLALGGALYGTAKIGGASNSSCGSPNQCGIVFKVTP